MASCALLHGASPRTDRAALCGRRRTQARVFILSVRAESGQDDVERVLSLPGSKGSVRLFGVTHISTSPRCAQFILSAKPAAVIVETSVDEEHGASTGNALRAGVFSQMESDAVRGMRGLAHMLSQEAGSADCADWVTRSATWTQLSKELPPEQLAYVAAMGSGALLARTHSHLRIPSDVYGDLPKTEVLERLSRMPLADLDRSYGLYSSINYVETALGSPLLPAESRPRLQAALERIRAAAKECGTERVMITERDEVLCRSLIDALKRSPDGSTVVGVVGASHVGGIADCWDRLASGGAAGTSAASTSAAAAPVGDGAGAGGYEEVGVRRALLERALVVRGSADVAEMIDIMLGPVPDEAWDAYESTAEIYGQTRMLYAAAEDDVLPDVVCARPKGTPLEKLVGPLRAVRPVNGGRGFSPELAEALRLLPVENDFFETAAAAASKMA